MARLSRPLPKHVPNQLGISLSEAVAMWERSLRAANRAPKTVDSYMYAMSRVTDILGSELPIKNVTRSAIESVVADLQSRGWKPASVSAVWRPLRTFLGWAVEHPDVPVETSPINGMKAPAVPVEPAAFPTADELRKVLATTITRSRFAFRARRDEAIIRLFASTGLRLAELSGLKLDNLDLQTGYPTATVLGKGRKIRTVPLDEATAAAIRRYLKEERPRSPFSGASEAVWLAPRGPMTESGVAQMIRDRGASVGVDLHPHALRHFAIDSMLRVMSEGDVMRVSGHTTRSMLDRYGAALAAERADAAFRASFSRRAAL